MGRPLISVLGFGFTFWGFGCVPFSSQVLHQFLVGFSGSLTSAHSKNHFEVRSIVIPPQPPPEAAAVGRGANDISQARFSESPTSRNSLIPEIYNTLDLKFTWAGVQTGIFHFPDSGGLEWGAPRFLSCFPNNQAQATPGGVGKGHLPLLRLALLVT